MLSPITEALLFLAVAAVLTVSAFRSSRSFLFLAGFLLPLTTPRLTLAIGVDWHKVLGPMAIALALIARRGRSSAGAAPIKTIGWFLAYVTILTTLWMWAEYSWLHRYRFAEAMGLGAGQSVYKMPVQLGSFIGQVLTVFVVPLWADSERDVRAGLNGYFAGCFASVLAGLANLVMFGAGTVNADPERGVFEVDQGSIVRLGGLSGEPKFLGAALFVVIAFAVTEQVFLRRLSRRGFALLLIGSLAGLFLTYSASAWIACALALALVMVLSLPHWQHSRAFPLVVIGGVLFVVVSSTALLSSAVQTAFVDKLFGESSNVTEMKDAYVFQAFADNPEHSVFGYGMGGGDLAVAPYMTELHLKYERTPTPSLTGVRLLGDLGLVGFLLLGGIIFSWARRLRALQDLPGSVFLLVGFAGLCFASMMALSAYLYVAGAVVVLAAFRARQPQVGPVVHQVSRLALAPRIS